MKYSTFHGRSNVIYVYGWSFQRDLCPWLACVFVEEDSHFHFHNCCKVIGEVCLELLFFFLLTLLQKYT